MIRPLTLVLTLAALLFLSFHAADTVGQPQTGKAPASPTGGIAVLDLVRIFGDAAQIKDLNEAINKKQAELQGEAQQRAKVIENKQTELSAFKAGTDDYESRRKELMRLNIEANVWLKASEQDLEVEKFNWTRIVYEKACTAAGVIAKERGYSMVIQRKDFKPTDIEPTVQNIRRIIQERDVLYFAQQMDITDVVLRRLDEEYKNGGGAKQLSSATAQPTTMNATP